MSLADLGTVLGNFVDALVAWRRIVAAAGAGKAEEIRAAEGVIRA